MTAEPDSAAHGEAVERLTDLGLGLYAARTFVALTVLSRGTASEVSQTADVPRTRVYDAVAELSEWNLVQIHDSTPKEFTPVGVEEATNSLLHEYESRVEALRTALSTLEDDRSRSEQ